jgi:hypothetical protein
LTRSESVCDLGDPDLGLLALLGACNEDDETVNLRDAVTTPADLGNSNVVFLSDLNRLWLEGPESTRTTAAVVPSSETRLFTS